MSRGDPELSLALARRATELLGDGEWRPLEDVIRALMPLVPPGRAIRRAEQERINAPTGRPAPAQRVIPRDVDKQIATGSRRIVYDFLASSTAFEHRGVAGPGRHAPNPDRQVRMVRPLRVLGTPAPRKVPTVGELARLRAALDRAARYLAENGHRQLARELREVLDSTGRPSRPEG